MITTQVITDFSQIDAAIEFIDAYPQLANDAVVDAFNREIKAPFLEELRYQPPAVKYPIQWASERQRKAFFASNGFGHGIPYQRTGGMVAGWQVGVQVFENEAVIFATNPSRTLRYVTGSRQQPFHRNTGWPLHAQTINFWADAAVDSAVRAVRALVWGK